MPEAWELQPPAPLSREAPVGAPAPGSSTHEEVVRAPPVTTAPGSAPAAPPTSAPERGDLGPATAPGPATSPASDQGSLGLPTGTPEAWETEPPPPHGTAYDALQGAMALAPHITDPATVRLGAYLAGLQGAPGSFEERGLREQASLDRERAEAQKRSPWAFSAGKLAASVPGAIAAGPSVPAQALVAGVGGYGENPTLAGAVYPAAAAGLGGTAAQALASPLATAAAKLEQRSVAPASKAVVEELKGLEHGASGKEGVQRLQAVFREYAERGTPLKTAADVAAARSDVGRSIGQVWEGSAATVSTAQLAAIKSSASQGFAPRVLDDEFARLVSMAGGKPGLTPAQVPATVVQRWWSGYVDPSGNRVPGVTDRLATYARDSSVRSTAKAQASNAFGRQVRAATVAQMSPAEQQALEHLNPRYRLLNVAADAAQAHDAAMAAQSGHEGARLADLASGAYGQLARAGTAAARAPLSVAQHVARHPARTAATMGQLGRISPDEETPPPEFAEGGVVKGGDKLRGYLESLRHEKPADDDRLRNTSAEYRGLVSGYNPSGAPR